MSKKRLRRRCESRAAKAGGGARQRDRDGARSCVWVRGWVRQWVPVLCVLRPNSSIQRDQKNKNKNCRHLVFMQRLLSLLRSPRRTYKYPISQAPSLSESSFPLFSPPFSFPSQPFSLPLVPVIFIPCGAVVTRCHQLPSSSSNIAPAHE